MARAKATRIVGLREATAGLPNTPIADETVGTAMLYSSGTTGRPKGILRPLPEQPPLQNLPIFDFLQKLWQYREGMIYLSPAPLYHSAPQAAVNLTIRVRRHRRHHGEISIPSVISSWSRNGASRIRNWCRRCFRAC